MIAAAIISGVVAIGTTVISYYSQKNATKAVGKQADAVSRSAEEQRKGTQSVATATIANSYYDYQKTEAQHEAIVKMVVIVAVVLILIVRIKTHK